MTDLCKATPQLGTESAVPRFLIPASRHIFTLCQCPTKDMEEELMFMFTEPHVVTFRMLGEIRLLPQLRIKSINHAFQKTNENIQWVKKSLLKLRIRYRIVSQETR